MIPPLYVGLFDDAAMFPPASLPMTEALRQHADLSEAWYAGAVGPLVCTASRLAELREQAFDGPLPLSVTVANAGAVPAALADVRADQRLNLRSVEVPCRFHETCPDAPDGVDVYVELAWDDGFFDAVSELDGRRAKFRTGGERVPPVEELAAAINVFARFGVPFKLTAGLHSAVRHEGGHGFLNVVLATASPAEARHLIGLADEREVVERIRALSADDVAAVRRSFLSFGTCSVGEPVADLVRLGLLP